MLNAFFENIVICTHVGGEITVFKKWIIVITTLLFIGIVIRMLLIIASHHQQPMHSNIVEPKNALPIIVGRQGVTKVNGHVIVNKTYQLPQHYKPGENKKARRKLNEMLDKAEQKELDLKYISGYRSYKDQQKVVKSYLENDGKKVAKQYTAKPGHSEHQTGLAFDVGTQRSLENFHEDFEHTKEAHWLAQNASKYGFIIRYPKGQSKHTGYAYEAWHLRYVGPELAGIIDNQDTNLESYYQLN